MDAPLTGDIVVLFLSDCPSTTHQLALKAVLRIYCTCMDVGRREMNNCMCFWLLINIVVTPGKVAILPH